MHTRQGKGSGLRLPTAFPGAGNAGGGAVLYCNIFYPLYKGVAGKPAGRSEFICKSCPFLLNKRGGLLDSGKAPLSEASSFPALGPLLLVTFLREGEEKLQKSQARQGAAEKIRRKGLATSPAVREEGRRGLSPFRQFLAIPLGDVDQDAHGGEAHYDVVPPFVARQLSFQSGEGAVNNPHPAARAGIRFAAV